MNHVDVVLDELAAGKYLPLTTFGRDGRAVPAPVWVMPDDRALAVWSPTLATRPYVRSMRPAKCAPVSGASTSAKPGVETPSGLPRQSQGPTITRPTLRICFTFPASAALLLAGALRGGSERTVGIRIRLDGWSGCRTAVGWWARPGLRS